MIDINKEAEEYLLGFREGEVPKSFEEVKQIYVAGHNSKATQAKILEAQINILNKTIDMFGNVNSTTTTGLMWELKQQLKQLENER
jgi:hypothetical protein